MTAPASGVGTWWSVGGEWAIAMALHDGERWGKEVAHILVISVRRG
jgi:hypothetical protein